jgi:hypothetical protein
MATRAIYVPLELEYQVSTSKLVMLLQNADSQNVASGFRIPVS